jgi:hypothetical protein
VFKVGGKVFAISGLDRTPLEERQVRTRAALQLRVTYAAIRAGYHGMMGSAGHDRASADRHEAHSRCGLHLLHWSAG